jgi:hypothetical protein
MIHKVTPCELTCSHSPPAHYSSHPGHQALGTCLPQELSTCGSNVYMSLSPSPCRPLLNWPLLVRPFLATLATLCLSATPVPRPLSTAAHKHY